MKILEIDFDYYQYPENIKCIDEFIKYVTDNYNSFIPLVQYQTENCAFPYLIAEEVKTVYVNVSRIEKIYEEESTVISTRKEYDARLQKIVDEKCTNCAHYEEDSEGDNLSGHREKLTLDGTCWMFEKK